MSDSDNAGKPSWMKRGGEVVTNHLQDCLQTGAVTMTLYGGYRGVKAGWGLVSGGRKTAEAAGAASSGYKLFG